MLPVEQARPEQRQLNARADWKRIGGLNENAMATDIGRRSMTAVAWRGVLKWNGHRKTAIAPAVNTGMGLYDLGAADILPPFVRARMP